MFTVRSTKENTIFKTLIEDYFKILMYFDNHSDERYIFKPITDQDKMLQSQN